jgi:signal transduction histidine kinase/CheY-like chemotaxis protein/integral membrane sensor domain MASE1
MLLSLTGRRLAAVYGVYFLLHLAFDLAARIFEVADGVSLWYPPVGLVLALAIIVGPRAFPVALAANLFTAFVTSASPATLSQLLLPLLITSIYVGAGALVRRRFGPLPVPNGTLQTAELITLHLAAPVCAACLGTTIATITGQFAWSEFARLSFGWWIGDLIGVLTITPLCLAHVAPRLLEITPPRWPPWTLRQLIEIAAQFLALLACLGLVHGVGYVRAYQSYYLSFVPLVWICLRHGLPGATLAVLLLTMGSLASLRFAGASIEVVIDLLLFEIAAATIGLGLGATVTRRAKAESERSRLLTIIEASPDLIGTADLAGRVLYQNAALLRLGRTPPPGSPLHHLVAEFHPSWATEKVVREGIPAAIARGIWQDETAFLDTEGREIPVSQLILAHYDESHRPVMLSTVARDITALKAAERGRLQSERNLLQAQKLESLGVLAGGIAHDFNNLLTVMLGNATLARLDVPPHSPAENAIHQIELAALRAAELCRQMLAYSGRGHLSTELVNLSKLVEETTHLLKVSISKKCALVFDLASDLPPVKGDATQLNQITMNLVMNASDACGERGGHIRVRTGLLDADRAYLSGTYLAPALEPGPYVFLEVEDDGAGIPADVLARIFEPFYTTKFSGHGLGLSAVLGIARSHHGAIKVDTTVGRGTTFRLLLPAAPGTAPAAAKTGAPSDAWRGSGRILVVDDEDAVREIATRILDRYGFTTVTAVNGREAVTLFVREPAAFRAVLLDLTMPVMDGEETFREIHAINPAVPVVLMSGYNRTESAGRFAGRGLAGFLQKPFEAARLIKTLRGVLEKNDPPAKR